VELLEFAGAIADLPAKQTWHAVSLPIAASA
jgi:hypothetical protein